MRLIALSLLAFLANCGTDTKREGSGPLSGGENKPTTIETIEKYDVERIKRELGLQDDQEDVARAYQAMYDLNTRKTLDIGTNKLSTLKAVTYNMGLLDLPIAAVPEYDTRSGNLETFLNKALSGDEAPDVVFLQELWYENDFNTVVKAASEMGFEAALTKYSGWGLFESYHGLQILVKKSMLSSSQASESAAFHQWPTDWVATQEQLVHVSKGFIHWRLQLSDGSQVLFSTTHLSPYDMGTPITQPENKRRVQARDFADFLTKATDADYIIAGGDFNAGPEIADKLDGDQTDWTHDYKPYEDFYDTTRSIDMVDSFRVTNMSTPGFTQDKKHNTLTAQSNTCKNEPEQRLDSLWIGSAKHKGDFFVNASLLTFDQPLTVVTQGVSHDLFFSDHFGVKAELKFVAP